MTTDERQQQIARHARRAALLALGGAALLTLPFLLGIEGPARALTLTGGALLLALSSTATIRLRALASPPKAGELEGREED